MAGKIRSETENSFPQLAIWHSFGDNRLLLFSIFLRFQKTFKIPSQAQPSSFKVNIWNLKTPKNTREVMIIDVLEGSDKGHKCLPMGENSVQAALVGWEDSTTLSHGKYRREFAITWVFLFHLGKLFPFVRLVLARTYSMGWVGG